MIELVELVEWGSKMHVIDQEAKPPALRSVSQARYYAHHTPKTHAPVPPGRTTTQSQVSHSRRFRSWRLSPCAITSSSTSVNSILSITHLHASCVGVLIRFVRDPGRRGAMGH